MEGGHKGCGSSSHPPCAEALPRPQAEPSEEQAHLLRLCHRHLGPARPAPRLQALEEAGSAPGCSPLQCPGTGAFWSSASSPGAAPPGPMLYLGPAQPGCPSARPGGTGGPSVSVVCVCVSVSHPAPWGCCTGMLCPPGSVHTVKSNCLKAVVLGFVFFPQFSPIPFTQLERRHWLLSALVGGGRQRGGRSRLSLFDHCHSPLGCQCKQAGLCGSTAPHPLRVLVQPPGRGLEGSGCWGSPAPHRRASCQLLPLGCSMGRGARAGQGVLGVPQPMLAVEGGRGGLPTFPIGSQLRLPLGVK